MKCRIVVPQSIRSDFGLSDPIIKELHADPTFEVIVLKVVPSSYRGAYAVAKNCCMVEKPDIFLIIGDRIEAAGLIAGIFHTEDKPLIIHYGAGIINGKVATLDDKNRHVISIYSDIQLCEDQGSYLRTLELFQILKLKSNAHIVGNTLYDEIDVIDYSIIPDEPFDLILYNPTTMYDEDIIELLPKLDKKTIWVQSNADPTKVNYYEIVRRKYPEFLEYYSNQPRPKFLGLLKQCKRYMSNSSNIKTEAPFLKRDEQIIPIGDRNLLRSTDCKVGVEASYKIVKIIKEWWLNHE